MKKKILPIIVLIILFCVLFSPYIHPLTHLKYWYQKLTNTTTEEFAICDGYFMNTADNQVFYEGNEYFYKNAENITDFFNVSNFTADGVIYIEAFLYDSFDSVSAYLNGKKITTTQDTNYYNIFHEKFYIIKTIRIWLEKDNFIFNNTNKLDFITKNNIYSYYFYVKN